ATLSRSMPAAGGTGATGAAGAGSLAGDLHGLAHVDHRVGTQVVGLHDGRDARVVLLRQAGDGIACGHLMADAAALGRGSMPAAGGTARLARIVRTAGGDAQGLP